MLAATPARQETTAWSSLSMSEVRGHFWFLFVQVVDLQHIDQVMKKIKGAITLTLVILER